MTWTDKISRWIRKNKLITIIIIITILIISIILQIVIFVIIPIIVIIIYVLLYRKEPPYKVILRKITDNNCDKISSYFREYDLLKLYKSELYKIDSYDLIEADLSTKYNIILKNYFGNFFVAINKLKCKKKVYIPFRLYGREIREILMSRQKNVSGYNRKIIKENIVEMGRQLEDMDDLML